MSRHEPVTDDAGRGGILRIVRDPSDWMIAVVLACLSLFVRLLFLNDGLFHPDEVTLTRAVEDSWDRGTLVGTFNGRFGSVLLNLAFYIPWNLVTGQGAERIIPFTGALTGSLLVASVYLLALELYESRVAAILSALFFGFNFLCLTTSTTGKENTHSLFFLTVGMYLLAVGHRRFSPGIRYAGYAAGAAAATMHEAVVPYLFVFLVFAVCLSVCRRQASRRGVVELLSGGLILLLPCIVGLWPVIGAALTAHHSSVTPVFLGIFSGKLSFALGELGTALGWHLLPLVAIGMFQARLRPWQSLAFLPWLLMIFYFGNVTTFTTRYLVYLMVPLSILAGVGSGSLVERAGARAVSLLVAAALGIGGAGYGFWKAYPLISLRSVYCGPKRMALFAREKTEPGALIVTMDASVFYEYYGKRETENHPVHDAPANRRFVERLVKMANEGRKIYVDSIAFSYDEMGDFKRYLSESFAFESVGWVVTEPWKNTELKGNMVRNPFFRLVPRDTGSSRTNAAGRRAA